MHSCEDSDPSVREKCLETLVALTRAAKKRGKSAVESTRILETMQQTNSKMFKRLQVGKSKSFEGVDGV